MGFIPIRTIDHSNLSCAECNQSAQRPKCRQADPGVGGLFTDPQRLITMTMTLRSSLIRSAVTRHSALKFGALTLALGALAGQAWAASATNGQTLYANASPMGCTGCHGTAPSGRVSKIQNGVSAQIIKNAVLANTGGMGFYNTTLTDNDYNDLAVYIATNLGTPNAATCIGGSCATAAPAVSVPASQSFGAAKPGTPVSRTITLTNSGSAALSVTSALLTTGTEYTKSTDTCTGASIAAAGTCTVTVAFNPVAAGATAITDTLTFTTNATPTTNAVSLTGTGTNVLAALSWAPATVSAPSTLVGTTSASLSATLTNGGPDVASLSGLGLTGTGASEFTALGGTCLTTATLANGASCTVTTTFKPTSAGTKTATLTMTTDGQAPATDLTFSGPGTSPAGSNSGGGGCTIGQAEQPMDPLWLLLLGGAGLALFQRRRPIAALNR